MANFIVRRLMVGALTIFLLSIVTFLLIRVAPGSPCAQYGMITAEQCRAIEHDLGYDKPYFPISIDPSQTENWWLLLVPVGAIVAGVFLKRRWAPRRLDA
jgi:ABC-type dipeptide/oligopeptide/nickel transport system permease component